MTAKNKAVADDVLGQIARRQNDLFRRVRDGSLDPEIVLASLQKITEGQSDRLNIERVEWSVSSMTYKIHVAEGKDFVTFLEKRGHAWKGSGRDGLGVSFTLKGVDAVKKGDLPLRSFRLAQVKKETVVGVIRIYADLEGYGLATAWDLVSFMEQSPIARIVSQSEIVALGSIGDIFWGESESTKHSPAFVSVEGVPQERRWVFDDKTIDESGEYPTSIPSYKYILLRDLHC